MIRRAPRALLVIRVHFSRREYYSENSCRFAIKIPSTQLRGTIEPYIHFRHLPANYDFIFDKSSVHSFVRAHVYSRNARRTRTFSSPKTSQEFTKFTAIGIRTLVMDGHVEGVLARKHGNAFRDAKDSNIEPQTRKFRRFATNIIRVRLRVT